jgi:hypothetical protein
MFIMTKYALKEIIIKLGVKYFFLNLDQMVVMNF